MQPALLLELLYEVIPESHHMPLVVLFVLDVKSSIDKMHAGCNLIFHEKGRLLWEYCSCTCLDKWLHIACLNVDYIESLSAWTN